MDYSDRNKKITIIVLRGCTFRSVGSIFDLTTERIRQITYRTIRKHNKDLFLSLLKDKSCKIKRLRENKNRIISNLQ